MTSLFKQAAKQHLRFDTIKGQYTAEDLWHIPLTSHDHFNLDHIALELNAEFNKASNQASFVTKKTGTDPIIELKFNIVKFIIDEKLEDQHIAEQRELTKQKRKQILAIINSKKDAKLQDTSIKKLEAMLEELGDT